MAERMASTEEEKGVERREVEKEVMVEEMEEEKEESLDDLPVFERLSKGRATVCLGDMKPRCSQGNDDNAIQAKSFDSWANDDSLPGLPTEKFKRPVMKFLKSKLVGHRV